MDMTRYIGKPIAMLLGLGACVGRTMTGGATRDLPAPDDSGVMKADEISRYALTELSDRFAIIAKDAASVPD
jgi:hypothetical protein